MKAVDGKGITFRYKGETSSLLESVSFQLEKGRIAAITGPSGCGKTTLGFCLCGVIPNLVEGFFSGEIHVEGRAGIVFQDPDTQVFFSSVEDELAFGPENLCLSREEIHNRVEGTLDLIGMRELRKTNPSRLSGGQKQLVALGGVLTLNPDVIVLDETLSQLDAAMRKNILNILGSLRQQGKALIMIEHEKANLAIADDIWYLNGGRLLKLSSIEEVDAFA